LPKISDFEQTLEGLEQGLQVQHIATFEPDLQTCAQQDKVRDVLGDESGRGFDQFPVKKDGAVIGVVERGEEYQSDRSPDNDDRSVKEIMVLLHDGILVAAEEPISHYIEICGTLPYYRLVVKGDKIQGIVTRGDLHKLPVRVVAFAFVTHLEMVLADVIRRKCPDEAWRAPDCLKPKRVRMAEKEQIRRAKDRTEISLLECTQFCDKREIVRKACNLNGQFEKDLKDIEQLRNSLAHASPFAQSQETLAQFIERLVKAKEWIRKLHEILESSTNRGCDACRASHSPVADK
jgi:predicted transcriptional regulator